MRYIRTWNKNLRLPAAHDPLFQQVVDQINAGKQPPAHPLFNGQRHNSKTKKAPRLEQWVEVRIEPNNQVTTTLYPSNDKLIELGQAMLPPPEFVYRRINFPDGIPHQYDWTGVRDDLHRQLGGCCLQRMTVRTWLEQIDKEFLRLDGHIGPTSVMNLPRPNGECSCPTCTESQRILHERERKARAAGQPYDLDSLLRTGL
jgi:hypothetical protein